MLKREIRRPETGPMQCNDDWPGVFIRGDDAFAHSLHLQVLLDDSNASPTEKALAKMYGLELHALLRSCIVKDGKYPSPRCLVTGEIEQIDD